MLRLYAICQDTANKVVYNSINIMNIVKSKTGGNNNAFVPTVQEGIAMLAVSIIALMAVNSFRLIDYYQNSAKSLGTDISLFQFDLLKRLDPRLLPTIQTFIVWSLIGLGFYLTVWFLFSVLGEAGHDAGVVHGFLFPKKTDRRMYELAILKRFGIRLLGICAALLWVILLFTTVLPACSVYFYLVFTQLQDPMVIGKAVVSVIALAIYLYLIAPALRMVVLKPRLFSDW